MVGSRLSRIEQDNWKLSALEVHPSPPILDIIRLFARPSGSKSVVVEDAMDTCDLTGRRLSELDIAVGRCNG